MNTSVKPAADMDDDLAYPARERHRVRVGMPVVEDLDGLPELTLGEALGILFRYGLGCAIVGVGVLLAMAKALDYVVNNYIL
jgi:hypothetical protein